MKPSEFDPKKVQGLSDEEASLRLKKYGLNELPEEKPRSFWAIAREVLLDPIFILMTASGLIYFVLGDLQEALMLLGFVIFIMLISLYQETKTERALDALRSLSSPRALVIRGGVQKRIPGVDVVTGDVLVLAEGDRVPADARVIWAVSLSADESLLTGESIPVRKSVWDGVLETSRPGGDDRPFVYSGTLIVQGQALAEVTAAGSQTEMGKIGKTLHSAEPEKTRLQSEMQNLVRILGAVGIFLCLLVVAIYGLTRGDWLAGFLAGLALAMAILPNEFPVVLTIFLALGAWRISKKRVLTRNVPAVENVGAVTVLCVDKTGTLTQNQMLVQKLFVPDGVFDAVEDAGKELSEMFHELVEFALLASQRDPFDPVEKALKTLAEGLLANTEHIHESWTLVRQYPLSPSLLALSYVWESPEKETYVIGGKGAPEAVFDLCHLSREQTALYTEAVKKFAQEGLRVLGAAKAVFKKSTLPPIQHDFEFQFLGLIGFADPVRAEVPAAVKECSSAGIRIVMITGDYPETACSIARQIGLKNPEVCLTGPELEGLNLEDLGRKISSTNILARVMPEQKLLIVQALKAVGEIVAMTGDGVNDAPALKAADIGIAMGKRGTDVAREAADLVLVEDDFASIVDAVKTGRRVFDNLKKAMVYLLAIHIPIAGISLIPVILKWPLVLMPVHIAFLHLIIDPACSVVFEMENEEKDIMRRPPRKVQESLFNKAMVLFSLLQGLSVLAFTAAVFAISLFLGQDAAEARALTFTTLITANLSLIVTNRSWSQSGILSWSQNLALGWVLGGGVIAMGLILTVPFFRGLFRFSILHPADILICLIVGISSVFWFEFLKKTLTRSRA